MNVLKPLTRDEVIRVIEGKGHASRIPVMLQFWNYIGVFPEDCQPEIQDLQDEFPEDVRFCMIPMPEAYTAPKETPNYRWINYKEPAAASEKVKGLDNNNFIEDLETEIDLFCQNMPDPNSVELFGDEKKRTADMYFAIGGIAFLNGNGG